MLFRSRPTGQARHDHAGPHNARQQRRNCACRQQVMQRSRSSARFTASLSAFGIGVHESHPHQDGQLALFGCGKAVDGLSHWIIPFGLGQASRPGSAVRGAAISRQPRALPALSDQAQPVPVGGLATVANGRRSECQDAGAGPFVVPVVQTFTRRRRGVAVVAPPLVG